MNAKAEWLVDRPFITPVQQNSVDKGKVVLVQVVTVVKFLCQEYKAHVETRVNEPAENSPHSRPKRFEHLGCSQESSPL